MALCQTCMCTATIYSWAIKPDKDNAAANTRKAIPMSPLRNPGRDISFPTFIRKEIETRKLERKSKQQISRLNDILYRLNDIISR